VAFVTGPDGLTGILDYYQPVLPGEGQEGIDIGHLAEKVHRDNSPGAGCNPFGSLVWVQIVGQRINISKYRGSPNL
jgi:hypothetical protein